MVSALDVNGAATRASLQGEAALGEGDTALARKKHSEAGDLLKSKVAEFPDVPRKAVARFLAASQYFRAGEYQKAAKLCAKINPEKLPDEDSRIHFSEFDREVRRRIAPGYLASARQELARNWKLGKRDLVLRRFQDDPYLLAPDALAFVRAIIAEGMREYTAAASLFALAYRISPAVQFATSAAGHLFKLTGDGELADAREFANRLVDLFPHTLTYAGAAMTCFSQASAVGWDHPEAEKILSEFLRLFQQSRSGYERLSPVERMDVEVREIMSATFGAAVLVAGKLDRRELASTISDEAIRNWPESVEAWVTRASLQYPEAVEVNAARRAAEMGSTYYSPYYLLSQIAFDQNDYRGALEWAEAALARLKPGQAAAARLHGWVAACLTLTGHREKANTLFQKAISLDPSDRDLQDAYEFFRTSPLEKEPRQLAIRLKRTAPEISVNFPLTSRQQEHRVENLLAVPA